MTRCLLCGVRRGAVANMNASTHKHRQSKALTELVLEFGLKESNEVPSFYHVCCRHFSHDHPQRIRNPRLYLLPRLQQPAARKRRADAVERELENPRPEKIPRRLFAGVIPDGRPGALYPGLVDLGGGDEISLSGLAAATDEVLESDVSDERLSQFRDRVYVDLGSLCVPHLRSASAVARGRPAGIESTSHS